MALPEPGPEAEGTWDRAAPAVRGAKSIAQTGIASAASRRTATVPPTKHSQRCPRRMRGVRRLWATATAWSQPRFCPDGPACNRELQESEVLFFVGEGGRRRPRASANQSAGFGHLAALIKLGIPASIQADRGAQASSLQIEPDQPALRR